MSYCVETPDKGVKLNPNANWDGTKNFEFTISGRSDSDYAKDPVTRRSITGYAAYLNGAPYSMRSKKQPWVALSVTEAEAVAASDCVRDMMYGKNFLESMGLKVKLPMVIEIDNQGAIAIFNSWSISGNSRAVGVRYAYVRELKEAGIIEVKWISGEENPPDLFTKNLDGPSYQTYADHYVSD